MKRTVLCTVLMITMLNGTSQEYQLPLWPEGQIAYRIDSDEAERHETDGILRISRVQVPGLDVYLPDPDKRTGKAVLIFPGGGYQILAYHWEGTDFARLLRDNGIAGIVVKYRLPVSKSLESPAWVPLSDAQRALRLCRERAASWGIDPEKIGVMGFSAGGHLAASLSTQYDARAYPERDAIDRESARPAFSALVYPVITFTRPSLHSGSREALLGKTPVDSLVRFFSPELQIDSLTPPAFLVHAADDTAVPLANSQLYFEALRAKGVPASLHVFPKGGHGFALGRDDAYLRRWTDLLLAWIQAQ
ncbi:MAG TPA: alpha/beta hydrolase [Robiginitalea sp.]|nr:alpha/beta hydrolase [Robiginitalea sp.]